jgi:hypothetical protein
MQQRLKVLRELVLDSSYVVDPDLVADAIVGRAQARHLVPGTRFRNDLRTSEPKLAPRVTTRADVRSFRPARSAYSFRLKAPRRSRDANHRAAVPTGV